MSGYSVRIPEELVKKIDEQIKSKKNFTTRPDFVLYALRSTIQLMADKYVQVNNMVKTNHNLSAMEGQIDIMVKGIGNALLEKFAEYKGDDVQIMIRIPEGINKQIDEFIIKIGLASNKMDFIRISLLCCLESIDRMEKISNNVDKYIKDAKESQDKLIRDVTNSILNGEHVDPFDVAVKHTMQ